MDTMRSAGKRGLVLAPVAALLLSVAALLLGNGLLSTLLIVRAGHKGFSTGAISAMMSFYFAGFTIEARSCCHRSSSPWDMSEPSPASRPLPR